jgi:FtsH-binding integral membrane protein
VTKKIYLIMAILTILLYTALVLYQTYVTEVGELFGYLFYVVIVSGIVAVIWLFIKPTKKE